MTKVNMVKTKMNNVQYVDGRVAVVTFRTSESGPFDIIMVPYDEERSKRDESANHILLFHRPSFNEIKLVGEYNMPFMHYFNDSQTNSKMLSVLYALTNYVEDRSEHNLFALKRIFNTWYYALHYLEILNEVTEKFDVGTIDNSVQDGNYSMKNYLTENEPIDAKNLIELVDNNSEVKEFIYNLRKRWEIVTFDGDVIDCRSITD